MPSHSFRFRPQPAAPDLLTQLTDVSVADVVEAIAERIMQLRLQGAPPEAASPALGSSQQASAAASEVGAGGGGL